MAIADAPTTKPINRKAVRRSVQIWMLIGVIMVFMQVVIGGVTRLTDSGLSITEWAVIQGTLPPMNAAEWDLAFEAYKGAAKKQYETLHANMTLSEFKFIYFWEYFHRLWARLMGFAFILPFAFFLVKGWLPKWLLKRLGIVIGLAALAATFGWVMVASGLNDDARTWVSAYKLITHLGIATILFGYLFWTWLMARQPLRTDAGLVQLKQLAWITTAVLLVQILFGGLMAGMRAGLLHPYWPMFVEGERLLWALGGSVSAENFVNYEASAYVKAIVQIIHRVAAYALVALIGFFAWRAFQRPISQRLRRGVILLLGLVGVQFILGVLTVINSVGRIPIDYGVLHQGAALLLFVSMLYVNYQFVSHKHRTV